MSVLLPYEFTLLSNYIGKQKAFQRFYYLMNLHYSQTTSLGSLLQDIVLLPYEFTLLSNSFCGCLCQFAVLLPYEFTLLSNIYLFQFRYFLVLLPYEFTLLSNLGEWGCHPTRFYYLMNLHYSQTS